MWSEFETEVSKHPHNTLDSFRAKISEVMADMDREVVICPSKKFRSRVLLPENLRAHLQLSV
jgi:hypothetical protein